MNIDDVMPAAAGACGAWAITNTKRPKAAKSGASGEQEQSESINLDSSEEEEESEYMDSDFS
jgi:ribosomal protein L12E/L44/L45/RPP1/RPP2